MTWSCKTPYIVYSPEGLYAGWDLDTGENLPRIGRRVMEAYEANKLLEKDQMQELFKRGGSVTESTVGGRPSSMWKHFRNCSVEAWHGPKHMKLSFVEGCELGSHYGSQWLDESDGTVYFMMPEELYDAMGRGLVQGKTMEADFGLVLRGGCYMGIAAV